MWWPIIVLVVACLVVGAVFAAALPLMALIWWDERNDL